MSSFDKYRRLKKSVARYGNPSFSRIVAGDLLRYSYGLEEYGWSNRRRFFHRAKPYFTEALDLFEWEEMLNSPEPLFSINAVRADYEAALGSVRERAGTFSNKIQLSGIRRVRSVHIKNILTGAYISLRALRGEPWLIRFYLAGCFTFYLNTLSALRRIKSIRIPYYVAFNSSDRIESIFCEFLKERGVKTYSLQHGFYAIYKDPIPWDAINYENITADHLLCWGKYSIEQLQAYGIPRDRLLRAGWLKFYDVSDIYFKSPVKKLLVLLGRQICHEGNLKLLEILHGVRRSGGDIDIVIKLHPELKLEKYQEVCNEYGFHMEQTSLISNLLAGGEYQAAVAINTTAYYEAYACGVTCFRYRPEEYYERCEDIQDDIFSDESEFRSLLAQYEQCDTARFREDICKRLEYVVGAGVDEYQRIFCEQDDRASSISAAW